MYPVIKAVQTSITENVTEFLTEYDLEMIIPQPWLKESYEEAEKRCGLQAQREPAVLMAMNVKSGIELFGENYPELKKRIDVLDFLNLMKRFKEISAFLSPLHRQYAVQLYLHYKIEKPHFMERKNLVLKVLADFTDKTERELLADIYLDISFGIPTKSLAFHIEQAYRAFLFYSVEFTDDKHTLLEAAFVGVYGQVLVDYFKLKARKKLKILDNYEKSFTGSAPEEFCSLKYRSLVCFRMMDIKEFAKFSIFKNTNPSYYKLLISNVALHRDSLPDERRGQLYTLLPGGMIEIKVLKKLGEDKDFNADTDLLLESFSRLTNYFFAKVGKHSSTRGLSTLREMISEINDLKFSGPVSDENKALINDLCDTVKETTSFVKNNAERNLSEKDWETLLVAVTGDGGDESTKSDDDGDDDEEGHVDFSRFTQILYAANRELIELFEGGSTVQTGRKRSTGTKKKRRRRRTSSQTAAKKEAEPSPSLQSLSQKSKISEETCKLFFVYAKQRLKERLERVKRVSSMAGLIEDDEILIFGDLVKDLLRKIQLTETKKDKSDVSLISFNQETETVIAKIQSRIDVVEGNLALVQAGCPELGPSIKSVGYILRKSAGTF